MATRIPNYNKTTWMPNETVVSSANLNKIEDQVELCTNEINTIELTPGPQGIQGEKGEPFRYSDFTPEQLESLRGRTGEKGEKGDSFKYSDFTQEQLDLLKGPKGDTGETGSVGKTGEKGEKGDAFKYTDFTPTQLEQLKGPKGDIGLTGPAGNDGRNGIDGKSVEMQKNSTHIQWRKENETWNNLLSIAEITGPAGPQGSQGLRGKYLEYKGLWNGTAGTTYYSNSDFQDIVSYQGTTYICRNTHITVSNKPPSTDTTNWSVLAQKGDTGLQGSTGLQGRSLNKVVDWQINTPYYCDPVKGIDQVMYNGELYQCIQTITMIGGDTYAPPNLPMYYKKISQKALNGTDGFTWRPAVDGNGNLTWTNNPSSTTPPSSNIKGPKGNPFIYSDFTPEQLESLRGPAGIDGKDGVSPDVSNLVTKTEFIPIKEHVDNNFRDYLVRTDYKRGQFIYDNNTLYIVEFDFNSGTKTIDMWLEVYITIVFTSNPLSTNTPATVEYVDGKFLTLSQRIGTMSSLKTNAKDKVVNSINELYDEIQLLKTQLASANSEITALKNRV